ncbi:MBL fold metallo-hydrolase [Pedobacter metabolipauper]|uniref:L-ascorbate metabolism protein UlaG (Beta-lactamase superfamily) n=1 Tax=Pedobacter metabolipauper TaxID=425513 RepID=A0A4R6T1Z2_9SPHI|nr:MBL fold metallo-hydrolase [Pedobacter metabolipauper]TDQ11530.1 L-ascorbate metabolism protein UlaG (beta-lactamase superfamily) [Pedobacter metabolipauper]
MEINITPIDTACILLEINGMKILTDPTLDNAGKLYYHGYGSVSRKTENPAMTKEQLKDVDLILLSHHQHKDNFDVNGKELTSQVARVISTRNAAKVMSNVTGLDDWESCSIEDPRVKNLKITATPAQHRPWWIPEFVSGKVIGFIIEFDGQQNGVIYISGDTVYFKGIREVAKRYRVDIGIFHVGSVQFRYLTGLGRYTMNGRDLLKAIHDLQPNYIIPIHYKGWTHFKEKEQTLKQVLASSVNLGNTLIFAPYGKRLKINK